MGTDRKTITFESLTPEEVEDLSGNVNLNDTMTIKHYLDDIARMWFLSQGHTEEHWLNNWKIFLSLIACAFGALSHFHPAKFPDNTDVLIVCVCGYFTCTFIMTLFAWTSESTALLVTKKITDFSAFDLSDRVLNNSDSVMLCTEMKPLQENYKISIKAAAKWTVKAERTIDVTHFFYDDGTVALDEFVKVLESIWREFYGKKEK
eukprot:70923_1